MEEDGPMYPSVIVAEVAEHHRQDLLREARSARLAREAASSVAGRRVRRVRLITFALWRRRVTAAV
jgi:hypothetical protein